MPEEKTALSKDLEIAGDKAQYDEEIKRILANKIILAWILKYCVKEFKQFSLEEVEEAIEGEPEISVIPIYPGSKPQRIIGNATEDNVPNEGSIRYDIRFYAIVPGEGRVKLLLNVEAQKSYYPGYDIVTRGIFYCARMLSAQLDTEFTSSDYDNIKKVYSIWICMNVPNYAVNTITKYSMYPENIAGDFSAPTRYDLLSVIMIRLGKKEERKEHPLIGMLSVLLSQKMKSEEKEEILNKQFGIKATSEMKERLNSMCNLSDLVEEEAWQRGLENGMRKGICESIFSLLEDLGEISDEIKEKILAEEDVDKLKLWNKTAARAESIETFWDKISSN